MQTRRTLLLMAALAAAGCSKRGPGPGGPGGAGGFKPPPMPVEVATVETRPVVDRFEAVGTLEAGEAITVVSEIDGVVVSLPFREGEPLAQGAPLAQLDDVQLRAEVSRAEALRDQSRTTWERVKAVVDQGAGAPQDLDDAAAALKVAEANLELARSRLSKTSIRAPWHGIVGTRRVSPGAFVRAGQALTDLTQMDNMKVRFSAPERYLGVLQRGAAVTVTTPAFAESLAGRIDVVEPVLDASLRSARIQARVPNPGRRLRPGMSANVTAVLQSRGAALTVPSEAIFAEGSQMLVYAVQPDSTVRRTPVVLGTRMPDCVEIVRGLEPGARVVRAGHQKLFEGARVMPVPSGLGEAGAPGTRPGDEPAAGGAPAEGAGR